MKDRNHPFFRPLWLRIAIVVVCFGWALVELYTNNPGWALLSAAIGAYAVWAFLLTYDPIDEPPSGSDGTGR